MSRRKKAVIQRAMLKTLEKRGPMTAGTLAKEIGATHRTVMRHLYILDRYGRKVEILKFYPDIRLYRLMKKKIIRCHRCRVKIMIPE